MTTAFHSVLQELGEMLDLDLIPDMRNACTLLYQDQFSLQMETDAYEKYLLVACPICELPPGKFRENVLSSALQFNSTYPLIATLGYNTKKNALVLSSMLPLENLKGKDLFSWIAQWIKIVNSWKKAIESGQTAPLEFQPKKSE